MNPIYWLYYPWGLQTTNYSGNASYADSVHMNAGGHAIIARRVIARGIFGGGGVVPIVYAGQPQEIYLPTSSVTLSATVTLQGSATSSTVVWSDNINPGSSTITSPTSLTTTVTGLTKGNHVFRIIATDNNGLKDTDYVRVNVKPACNVTAFKAFTATPSSGDIYYPNASATFTNIYGGDTIHIPAGQYGLIEFSNLYGDPCHKIIIKMDGMVYCNQFRFDDHVEYVEVDGTYLTESYGLRIRDSLNTGLKNAGLGIGLCNNLKIHNFYIYRKLSSGVGIYCKKLTDSTNAETIYPNYLMDSLSLYNFKIDSIDGEGTYIGHTAPNGGDQQGPGYPIRLDHFEAYNFIITNTNWDGFQLSNARNSSVHNGSVYNAGILQISSQNSGFIFGGNTTGNLHDLTINKASGNGLEIFGYGTINAYNISIDSTGYFQTVQSFFSNDPLITVEANPAQQINFYNNYIKHPYGIALKAQNDNGTATYFNAHDNQFCIPGANPITWQASHIQLSPPGSINTNNFLTNCSILTAQQRGYFQKPKGVKYHWQ